MSKFYTISSSKLTLKDINDIIFNHKQIKLSSEVISSIKKSKQYLKPLPKMIIHFRHNKTLNELK